MTAVLSSNLCCQCSGAVYSLMCYYTAILFVRSAVTTVTEEVKKPEL
jgi:hypothetical protein